MLVGPDAHRYGERQVPARITSTDAPQRKTLLSSRRNISLGPTPRELGPEVFSATLSPVKNHNRSPLSTLAARRTDEGAHRLTLKRRTQAPIARSRTAHPA